MQHSAALRSSPARRMSRPYCPKCNDKLFAPEISRLVEETIVEHIWSCDSCGYVFETSVRLLHRQPLPQPVAA